MRIAKLGALLLVLSLSLSTGMCAPHQQALPFGSSPDEESDPSHVQRVVKLLDDCPIWFGVGLFDQRGRDHFMRDFEGIAKEDTETIREPENALVFVRLRISPALTDCWADATIHEIVSFDYACTSEYSRTNWGIARYPHGATWHLKPGAYGILASAAYRAGGFDPVTVQRTHAGYVVTRWVRIFDKRGVCCEK